MEHRQRRFAQPGHQPGENPAAARDVDGGQRFVEQQERRTGQQRAGKRDALTLPSRQAGNLAIDQRLHFQHVEHGVQAALRRALERAAIEHVLANRQVREERRVLRRIADAAVSRRNPRARGRVHEHAIAERDAAARRRSAGRQ